MVQEPPQRAGSGAFEPEVLFEEARRLRRRRWLIGSSLAAAAAIVGGVVALILNVGSTNGLRRIGPGGPKVDASALRNEGKLAFVSRSRLYIVDGASGSVTEVPVGPGRSAVRPTFSRDGSWVAYQTEPRNGSIDGSSKPGVWIARADGSDRHEVSGADGFFGWSPTRDVIAISVDTRVPFPRGAVGQVPTAVDLVAPSGSRTRLVALGRGRGASSGADYRIWSAAWSPSGTALAVSLVSGTRGSIVRSYPISGGGPPTTWFAIDGKSALPGVCRTCGGGDTVASLAGWWPKRGIGFWVFSSGAVRNLDSTPLELVRAPGIKPRLIGWTLSDGSTNALAASRTGSLAIVSSAIDAGREYGNGKQIATCDVAGERCTPIPGGSTWTGNAIPCSKPCSQGPRPGTSGSAVSLDPVWSPTQNLLAYVKSPRTDSSGNPSAAWYAAHRLFIYNPKTRRSTQVDRVTGVSAPTWSHDGTQLLYVSGDALWLAPAAGGTPVEVATPLFGRSRWLGSSGALINYYGQVPWTAQFSWWTPRTDRRGLTK